MKDAELKQLSTEINTTFETLKEALGKQEKEVRAHGEATAETREQVDKINDAITELREQYENVVKLANRPHFNGEQRDEDPEMELRKSAFVKMLRHGASEAGFTPEEKRALSGTSDSDGGFLVPPAFEAGLIKNAYNAGELRPLCQVGLTGRDTVIMGKLAKPKVAWGTRGVAIDPQELGTGQERMEIFNQRALVLISNDTLDDEAADVWGELEEMFAMALAETEDDAFIAGSGAGQPGGVLTDTRVQANKVVTGVAAAISDGSNNGIDALIGALHKLKKVYRRNATWAMNSLTEAEVRKLKDGQGQYLWQPPVQAGSPATLLGRPVVNPEGTPDIAANAYPIVVGDFRSGYKIRDRAGLSVQRLNEKYADVDQTGMIIKRRLGGQVTLPEAFVPVQVAAS